MGKADLHVHSIFSDGTCTVEAALDWAANFTGLDVIAITDHDTLAGAWEAQQHAPKFGIHVLTGCEITTREGHLLAFDIAREIPAGRSLLETILRVADQGGFCLPAHPTDGLARGASREVIWAALQHPRAREAMVGLEAFNAGIFNQRANARAARLAGEMGLSAAGGSDSHVFWTIGWGYTSFPGSTAADLRHALRARTTTAHRGETPRTPGYWPRHAFSFLLRKAGWVASSRGAASPGLRRLGL
jgi:predicted metal-dependent phosphoesterase TrpH